MTDASIQLKTVNPYFQQSWERRKPFELRLDDRGYEVGQVWLLREYDPKTCLFLPRGLRVEIVGMLKDFDGLLPNYCIWSYEELARFDLLQSKQPQS